MLSDFAASSVRSSTITYNAATSACDKGRRWQSALHLLGKLKLSGMQADAFSHNSIISASENFPQWQSVAVFLDGMRHATILAEPRPKIEHAVQLA